MLKFPFRFFPTDFTTYYFLGFKFAAIQIGAGTDKALNLQRAASLVANAAKDGAKVVSLPECFNSPYGTGIHFLKKILLSLPPAQGNAVSLLVIRIPRNFIIMSSQSRCVLLKKYGLLDIELWKIPLL